MSARVISPCPVVHATLPPSALPNRPDYLMPPAAPGCRSRRGKRWPREPISPHLVASWPTRPPNWPRRSSCLRPIRRTQTPPKPASHLTSVPFRIPGDASRHPPPSRAIPRHPAPPPDHPPRISGHFGHIACPLASRDSGPGPVSRRQMALGRASRRRRPRTSTPATASGAEPAIRYISILPRSSQRGAACVIVSPVVLLDPSEQP
jgi:hypothetical protein